MVRQVKEKQKVRIIMADKMILKNLFYKTLEDGLVQLIFIIENEMLFIKDLRCFKNGKNTIWLEDFEQYLPIKSKIGLTILELKVNWSERDLRVKLSDESFIVLFRDSDFNYMLDIFEKTDVDDDFLNVFNRDSVRIDVC